MTLTNEQLIGSLSAQITRLSEDELMLLLAIVARERDYMYVQVTKEAWLPSPFEPRDVHTIDTMTVTPGTQGYGYSDYSTNVHNDWPHGLGPSKPRVEDE